MPPTDENRAPASPAGGTVRETGAGRAHVHSHAESAAVRPALRLVPSGSTAAPAVIHLSPSLMRMGAAGRLAVALILLVLVWGATLAVTA